MRAIVIREPGGPDVLELREVATPEAGPGHVRVRIRASAVNRADLLQRLGGYPAPADSPQDIPGLEIAGEIDQLGPGVTEWRLGDRVFGVVGGGAYAEAVVVHARTLAKMSANLDFVQAAAIPEAFVTAYDAMVTQAGLSAGEVVVIHAVGSGVGTAAVQIAHAIGARSIGTARSASKLERATALGMMSGIVPITRDGAPIFAPDVIAQTGGVGANVVLDLVGGRYVPESLASLTLKGRLVLVGLLGGARAEIDLGLVLRRRLRMMGTVLRARPLEEKILAAQMLQHALVPLFATGALVPIIERTFPLENASAAHTFLATNEGFGKVVLTM
jgi:putative PIG3 family NAD(P)H quinone oxidoreductase